MGAVGAFGFAADANAGWTVTVRVGVTGIGASVVVGFAAGLSDPPPPVQDATITPASATAAIPVRRDTSLPRAINAGESNAARFVSCGGLRPRQRSAS